MLTSNAGGAGGAALLHRRGPLRVAVGARLPRRLRPDRRGAPPARAARRARAGADGDGDAAAAAADAPAGTTPGLVDDAAIDAKITPELFSGPPASTGLVTRESHAWWRYAAKVDGRPDLSTEDELLLNRDEEATRVATTTERLIRTQAAHPREFHRVLDDAQHAQ